MPVRWLVWSAILVAGIAGGLGIGAALQAPPEAAATIPHLPPAPNPRLDTGMALKAVAPAFTLTDQFGKAVSLSSFRGKVVVLSFNDPQCTTICPLTTTAMLEGKKLLGPAGADVELVGVGANPDATSVSAVRDYSAAHGMLHQWRFLTGSLPQLQRVWKAYAIYTAVIKGTIDHTPATYVIDPQGRETRLFISAMSYSSVPQLAEVLARGIAADLPGHPPVLSSVSLATIKLIGPGKHVTLRNAGHGRPVRLGPGRGPRLYLFFDTWEQKVANLSAGLIGLNRYAGPAPLVAIDEANVETSPRSLPNFLRRLPGLGTTYPVAIDPDGRVADGYGVQDSPWLTLVSGKGRILWRYDVAAEGWPTAAQLARRVRAAIGR